MISDLPIKDFRTIFSIVVIWSLVLFAYDFIMLKTGLLEKFLRKAKPLTPKKYRGFKTLLILLMPIVPLISLSSYVTIGFLTGKWEFWLYVWGCPTVLAFPSWLILKHIGQVQVRKMNKD